MNAIGQPSLTCTRASYGSAGIRLLLVVACLAVGAEAQEGHPLVGSWYGTWGASASQRNDVTIVMSWDGKNISGMINPGPDAVPFKVATLDSSKWTVHIEAEGKDRAGSIVRYTIDGKLENIGSYNRTLTGTWIQGSVKGDFKIGRE
jgi:hypothetical protein